MAVTHGQRVVSVSERRACQVLSQPRSTQRYRARVLDDEAALTAAIVRLASRYGRYGYRRITALLRREGWSVNHKRVERIWRREGLKVPRRQPKRGRLWLTDGSCVRLRPTLLKRVDQLAQSGSKFAKLGEGRPPRPAPARAVKEGELESALEDLPEQIETGAALEEGSGDDVVFDDEDHD